MCKRRFLNIWYWEKLPDMRKLPQRYAPLIFAVLMSCVMAFIVSSVVTFVNTGINAGFVQRWLRAFLIAWPVAGTCILLFRPHVQRFASRIVAS